jgi:gluconokinase
LADRKEHFMKQEMLASQLETLEEPADAFVVGIDAPPEAIVRRIRGHFSL